MTNEENPIESIIQVTKENTEKIAYWADVTERAFRLIEEQEAYIKRLKIALMTNLIIMGVILINEVLLILKLLLR